MPTVPTNGIETYYERRGTGPPIVFVHGAVLDRTQWTPQLDALAADYTVVAYDVRGHGRTGGSPAETYSMGLFAADLAALVEALELDRPVVSGLSMGGCIAQVYAVRYPDRLSGLVLSDTLSSTVLSRGEGLHRALLRATIPPARLVGYERVERVMVWLQERVSGERVSGDYDRIERLRDAGPTMATEEFAKVIRALSRFHETDLDLGAVAVPALVLHGEHAPGFVRRQAAFLADALPDATLRQIPGAGHASNFDNPAAFTRELRSFCERVADDGVNA